MNIKSYLIFNLHHRRYAIAAESVTEIFLLPELIPVAEAPPDIVGLLQLRGNFVPVMHLDLRFGHQFDRCHLTDNVIMVESQGLQVGLIVHQVETVNEVDERYVRDTLDYGRESKIDRAFVRGAIDLDDETIILLDVANLLRHPTAIEHLVDSEDITSAKPVAQNFYERYFIAASGQTKEILHRRAIALKKSSDREIATKLISLAVVSIAGQYFGLDLGLVREFINLERITTIPCCPQHIVGNVNLRGDILTLIDIRQQLNLTLQRQLNATKAVVVEVDEIIAGIVVEGVYDVIEIHPERFKSVPVAADNNASWLKGVADYRGKMLEVLDLQRLLGGGSMIVELIA